MALVALISNPRSTGNKSLLPQVRRFCASHSDIFHYEVEHVSQIAEALRTIALVKPKVLVINGGDGTVQAALTELYHGNQFGASPPPVAVLPNGKTNLIAADLGAIGSPLDALARIVEIARSDMAPHIVERQMIALSSAAQQRPVLGMFLGGAGLAEFILYCRNKIYPLGLPNGFSHFLAGVAGVTSLFFKSSLRFLPARAQPMRISLVRDGETHGSYSLLIVTTLDKLLLNSRMDNQGTTLQRMKFLAVDQSPMVLFRAIWAAICGRLGQSSMQGVHFRQGDEIRIDGNHSNLILDGEVFNTSRDMPITLRSTPPVPFLRLAA